MGVRAGYLMHGADGERATRSTSTPSSPGGRAGSPVYAALRALGRSRGRRRWSSACCALARRFAEQLGAAAGVEVLNDVVLNQVLVRFGDDDDADPARWSTRVQHDGTCWMSGTTWQGKAAMRISVSNWTTDEADVDRSVAAILRCMREAG